MTPVSHQKYLELYHFDTKTGYNGIDGTLARVSHVNITVLQFSLDCILHLLRTGTVTKGAHQAGFCYGKWPCSSANICKIMGHFPSPCFVFIAGGYSKCWLSSSEMFYCKWNDLPSNHWVEALNCKSVVVLVLQRSQKFPQQRSALIIRKLVIIL